MTATVCATWSQWLMHSLAELSKHLDLGVPSDDRMMSLTFMKTGYATGRIEVETQALRNIALTAPYMHDGSLATLADVVAHFNSGGLNDPTKSPLMVPLGLTAQQQEDLVAFLYSLTDGRSLDQVP